MKRKARKLEEKQMSVREVADLLVHAVPEIQESLTQADIELALDDRGWLGFTAPVPNDFDSRTRKVLVERARLYWLRDPLAKQAVRLWTTYCFGNGMSYEAADAGVQGELDAFTKNRRNRHLFNPRGQQKLSRKLLIDGEIFFALFATDPIPTLRTIDPLQITKVICDPDDDELVLCYRRETASGKKLYYVDWAVSPDELPEGLEDPDTHQGFELEKDDSGNLIPIYHLAFDELGKRGNGLLMCCLDWSREHRRFMESRVALAQALAKFAYKLTAKGGQAALNALQNKLKSSLVDSGLSTGIERNPTPAPGATWLQNLGVDLAPMPRTTGAGDAKEDGDQLKLMMAAGTGIMLHYFGDPSTGNLATATAMELPMLKQFAGYQELWKSAFRDLFAMALGEDPDEEPAEITIELPPILDEDLQKLGAFLSPLTTTFPEAKVPEVLRTCLIAMGVENVDEVMDATAERRAEIDAQPKPVLPTPQPTPPNPAQPTQESLTRLAEAIEESNRAVRELPQITPTTPIDLNLTVQSPERRVLKRGKAVRNAQGDIEITMEEQPAATA